MFYIGYLESFEFSEGFLGLFRGNSKVKGNINSFLSCGVWFPKLAVIYGWLGFKS